jgi:hypothetical protein
MADSAVAKYIFLPMLLLFFGAAVNVVETYSPSFLISTENRRCLDSAVKLLGLLPLEAFTP